MFKGELVGPVLLKFVQAVKVNTYKEMNLIQYTMESFGLVPVCLCM